MPVPAVISLALCRAAIRCTHIQFRLRLKVIILKRALSFFHIAIEFRGTGGTRAILIESRDGQARVRGRGMTGQSFSFYTARWINTRPAPGLRGLLLNVGDLFCFLNRGTNEHGIRLVV